MFLIGILLIAAGVLILAVGRFAHANTVGLILVALGAIAILVDVVPSDVEAASAGALILGLPLPERLRSRLMWWRHDLDRWLDMRALDLARVLPKRLRMWVVVDSTNEARRLYPHASGYAGPDGLTYAHIHDGARRERPSWDRVVAEARVAEESAAR